MRTLDLKKRQVLVFGDLSNIKDLNPSIRKYKGFTSIEILNDINTKRRKLKKIEKEIILDDFLDNSIVKRVGRNLYDVVKKYDVDFYNENLAPRIEEYNNNILNSSTLNKTFSRFIESDAIVEDYDDNDKKFFIPSDASFVNHCYVFNRDLLDSMDKIYISNMNKVSEDYYLNVRDSNKDIVKFYSFGFNIDDTQYLKTIKLSIEEKEFLQKNVLWMFNSSNPYFFDNFNLNIIQYPLTGKNIIINDGYSFYKVELEEKLNHSYASVFAVAHSNLYDSIIESIPDKIKNLLVLKDTHKVLNLIKLMTISEMQFGKILLSIVGCLCDEDFKIDIDNFMVMYKGLDHLGTLSQLLDNYKSNIYFTNSKQSLRYNDNYFQDKDNSRYIDLLSLCGKRLDFLDIINPLRDYRKWSKEFTNSNMITSLENIKIKLNNSIIYLKEIIDAVGEGELISNPIYNKIKTNLELSERVYGYFKKLE